MGETLESDLSEIRNLGDYVETHEEELPFVYNKMAELFGDACKKMDFYFNKIKKRIQ